MRKSTKWTLIGLGIFIGVVIVAVIIIFVGLFVSAGVSAIKEVSTPETKQVEQAEEEVAIEEISKAESEEATGTKEGLQNLTTGQEFIYNGVKIALTKYEITPINIDKNLLWVYLYVENIDNVPHNHIYDEMNFITYHKGREDGYLSGIPGILEGRKMYDTGEYSELYPDKVCEGWTCTYYREIGHRLSFLADRQSRF